MKFLSALLFTSVALATPVWQDIRNGHIARRSDQIGFGDRGGDNTDNSESVAVNSVGDSILAGKGNTFSAVARIVNGNAGDQLRRRGLINALGIAGNAGSNDDSSTNQNTVAGGNQQFSGTGNSNAPQLTIEGQTTDQSFKS